MDELLLPPVFDHESNSWLLIDTNGYVRVYKDKPAYHNWRDFSYQHRNVLEKELGRQMLKHEVIHHVDRNRSNNKPENLRLVADKREHVLKEHPEWLKKKAARCDSFMLDKGAIDGAADVKFLRALRAASSGAGTLAKKPYNAVGRQQAEKRLGVDLTSMADMQKLRDAA